MRTAPASIGVSTIDPAEGRAAGGSSSTFLSSEPIGALLAGAGIGALVAYMLWLGRGLWFYSDDWNLIAWYHHDHFLTPFNGHLSLVPVLVYRLLFATAGIGTYLPYRVAGLAAYAFLGVMIYCYGRSRVPPVIAALASLAVMWYSAAQLDVSFPVLLNFSLPLALLIAIWTLLDRKTA